MLKAIRRWYLRVKLNLVTREINDCSLEQEEAVLAGDVNTVIALENWLAELARERTRLLAEIRRLS